MLKTSSIVRFGAAASAGALIIAAGVAGRTAAGTTKRPADLAAELVSAGADETPAAVVNGQPISTGRVRAYESLANQNRDITGQPPPSRDEILNGLIDDELLYQEAIRRGLQASAEDAAKAAEATRQGMDKQQMEFVLAYALQNSGRTVDEQSYWSMPEVIEGFRRSLSVQALTLSLQTGDPSKRADAVAMEVKRLRAEGSVIMSPTLR